MKINRGIKRTIAELKNLLLSNYFFIPWLITEAIICAILNYRSDAQSGLIQTYLQYAQFIRSGFNLSVEPYLYTFPMWGYGFVLSITKSKTLLIILQQIFAICTLLFIDNSLSKLNWRVSSKVVFRVFTLIAFPWFFFHTVIWPYSWGANLLMFAIFLLFRYLSNPKLVWILLSAFSFGIMLNFRSDYLIFTIFLTILIPILQWVKNKEFKPLHLLMWMGTILLLLIPWSEYSKIKSGHRLFKTTNKGHFLFISLGQLSNNPWHITPLDKDSLMAKIVKDSLGEKGTITYQADTLLTKMWFHLIKKEPKAFAQKCLVNFKKLNDFPFYRGELWNHKGVVWEDSLMQLPLDYQIRDFSTQLTIKANKRGTFRPLHSLLYYQARLITVLTYLALVLYFTRIKELFKDGVSLIMFSMIAYQAAISILTFYTKEHNTNIYLIYILWLIYIFNEQRLFPLKSLLAYMQKIKKIVQELT